MPDKLEPAVVQLPDAIDLRTIGALHQTLVSLKGQAVDLDGSAVQRIGGLGLQVLASAFHTWAADGSPIRICDPSEALSRSLDQMGFSPAGSAQSEELLP